MPTRRLKATTIHPPLPQRPKRIVVKHNAGRFQGLWRIVGTVDQVAQPGQDLPLAIDEVDLIDHTAACAVLAVRNRYVLYSEIVP